MMQCPNTDQLAGILVEENPDAAMPEMMSHVRGCSRCQTALQELRQLAMAAGEYSAFLNSADEAVPQTTIDRIRNNTQPAFRSAIKREKRRQRQPSTISNVQRLVAGAVGAILALSIMFLVVNFREQINPRGGGAADAFQASLVLWGGIEPAGTDAPVTTNRNPGISRLGIVTSNHNGVFQILRINGNQGIVPQTEDWQTCRELQPVLLPMTAPPNGIQDEWFVACVIPGEISEDRLKFLSITLNTMLQGNLQTILLATTEPLMNELEQDLSRQLSAVATTDCQVILSRWRVNS